LTGADTQAYRAAFAKLELLVVIDVALTETARRAHYVLPAASQLEKWETTFFNLDFPRQAMHLRRPLLPPRRGTLPEPEIYRRLLVAMGELQEGGFPWLRAVARVDRLAPRLRLYPSALAAALRLRPKLAPYAAFVVADTLGPTLPHGAAATAPLWASAHAYAQKHAAAVRRTGLKGAVVDLGEALFQRMLESPSGALISEHDYAESFQFIRHRDGKIHLEIPELLDELRALAREPAPAVDERFPFVLIAGERRSYNANQILRDPRWRKVDPDGALHIHPDDARRLGLAEGARALCESSRGQVEVRVSLDGALQPGLLSLPHGYGMDYPAPDGERRANGPALNVLTDAKHRDPIAATPYHKYVPVRLRAIP
jgi:anaerobic selenocysteine-containing dehydrogenase